MSPREQRRAQRVATSREQILDAAEELFGDQGYRATSLQQVAGRAEFSVGALYQFFASKDELLRAVMKRRGLVQLAEMTAAADDGLLPLVDTILAFHRRYPAFGRLSARVYSPGSDAPAGYDATEPTYRTAMDLYATAIRRGQAAGRVRGGDPQALARLLSSLVTAFHRVDAELGQDGPTLDDGTFRRILTRAFAA
ncbi:TetR/AcrR family transcriptional regulator [Cryptosporangium phraense]|uniref:TetR/AcrR family transcriptional regulator n=1 Tax=Cryptosporangium phraense TaxID=2593070 RepID=A0A545AL68_9ACTN|nr:TetR/AcrR family transcriptional regulator [Cryptosporangium phraense]TQS42031.1 TetR/AcrR family transcriptional regulator [Cryptosporangium phraense]